MVDIGFGSNGRYRIQIAQNVSIMIKIVLAKNGFGSKGSGSNGKYLKKDLNRMVDIGLGSRLMFELGLKSNGQ